MELEKDVLGGNVVYPLFGYEEIEFNKRCINKTWYMNHSLMIM
nr:hypothetical protein CoNPh37_CDS0156 [Staphylococcus phage S-CoN_Ph37]